MHDKDDLDILLDAALASYGDNGPEFELEQRILARVANVRASAESKAASRRRWLPWPAALMAFASLLLVFCVMKAPHRHSSPPDNLENMQPQRSAVAQSEKPASVQPKVAWHPARPAHSQFHLEESISSQPKLDVFPTPTPLTPQEQALVTIATQTPPSQRKSLLEAARAGGAPINIAAIRINPLEMPDEGKN